MSNAFLRSSITALTSSPESNPLMIYSVTSMSAVSVENLLLKPDLYSYNNLVSFKSIGRQLIVYNPFKNLHYHRNDRYWPII